VFLYYGTYTGDDGEEVEIHVENGYEPGNDALREEVEANLVARLRAGKGGAARVLVGREESLSFSF
jgi:hypothetical protein